MDLDDGDVRVLLEEGDYSGIQVAEDGSHITYTVNNRMETSYTRRGGTEYSLNLLGLEEGAEPRELIEPTEDRIRADFSPDGSAYAYAERGNIFLRPLDADSAVNPGATEV